VVASVTELFMSLRSILEEILGKHYRIGRWYSPPASASIHNYKYGLVLLHLCDLIHLVVLVHVVVHDGKSFVYRLLKKFSLSLALPLK
jgi:hypothetical protein